MSREGRVVALFVGVLLPGLIAAGLPWAWAPTSPAGLAWVVRAGALGTGLLLLVTPVITLRSPALLPGFLGIAGFVWLVYVAIIAVAARGDAELPRHVFLYGGFSLLGLVIAAVYLLVRR